MHEPQRNERYGCQYSQVGPNVLVSREQSEDPLLRSSEQVVGRDQLPLAVKVDDVGQLTTSWTWAGTCIDTLTDT